jgi:glycosyltransferase involved in cell wall biosynthesis
VSEAADRGSGLAALGEERHFIYVTETDLSVDNGPGINEREFVQALTDHWPDVVTCVAPYPLHPGNYLNPLVRYAAPHGRKATGYPRFLVSATSLILKLCAQRRADAVAFRFGSTPLIPYALTKFGDTPVMLKTFVPLAALGPHMRLGRFREGLSRLLKPAYRTVVSSAIAADTVSVPYRDWVCERYDIPRQRIRVIPNGANTDVFTPGSAEAARQALGLERFDFVIGYVGALSRIRYVDVLIRAVAGMRADGSIGLVLVGGGAERASLEELAQGEGTADRVVFAGSVPYSRVREFVNSFDVAVDLTGVEMEIGGRTVLSSFSQKIPQYLACGVPVVAWQCGDTQFLEEEDAGGVVGFRDEKELARVLTRLIGEDGRARSQRRERARRLAELRLSTVKLAGDRVDWWRSAVASREAVDSG